jgi:Fic family protein
LVSSGGLILHRTLIKMFQLLKKHGGGLRNTPGTALRNESIGEAAGVPPQAAGEIQTAMTALEMFINEDDALELEPLTKMALIHHQFESIPPFLDGNGRTDRIINVLYLIRTGLLDIPILYLSRHITQTKGDCYRPLQQFRDTGEWEPWVIYMLDATASTAITTLDLVIGVRGQMTAVTQLMSERLP